MVFLLLCGGGAVPDEAVAVTGEPTWRKPKRRGGGCNNVTPPLSSVLVQTKTTTALSATEEESLGGMSQDNSFSLLTPIVEDAASCDSLTEEDDILQLAAGHRRMSSQTNATAAAFLMPVVSLLVQTILDDPSVHVTRSACFEAILRCASNKVEMRRLREQVEELQQTKHEGGSGAGRDGDLTLFQSKRDSKARAEATLQESYIKYREAPVPLRINAQAPDVSRLGMNHDDDYSCIIPLDSNQSAASVSCITDSCYELHERESIADSHSLQESRLESLRSRCHSLETRTQDLIKSQLSSAVTATTLLSNESSSTDHSCEIDMALPSPSPSVASGRGPGSCQDQVGDHHQHHGVHPTSTSSSKKHSLRRPRRRERSTSSSRSHSSVRLEL